MPGVLPQLTKAERKYLERHAEPEASCATRLVEPGGPDPYAAVLVIPSYGEDASLRHTLASVPSCSRGRLLIVLVVNQREDSPEWARSANSSLLARLRPNSTDSSRWRVLAPGVEHWLTQHHDTVLIDRSETGRRLPSHQGVGLARKIGCDFALSLWAHGGLKSGWIHCTDADVSLPADYFERPRRFFESNRGAAAATTPAALLYDYRHESDDPTDGGVAILQYEIFLRYYVLGMRSAGSVYAFQSVGSTLAIHPPAYAQVRGFPKREAAEDFHLLAKLAKVGRILPLRGDPIVISGRESSRVPFGTGRAVSLGRARALRGESLPVYDPRNFAWLGVWLEALTSLAEQPMTPVLQLLERHAEGTQVDPLRLGQVLDQVGVTRSIMPILAKKRNRLRSLNECFDALATLKLIHALRDRIHPAIPLELALQRASFIQNQRGGEPPGPRFNPEASLEEQRDFLAKLEAHG